MPNWSTDPDTRAMVREHCEHEEQVRGMQRLTIHHTPDLTPAQALRHVLAYLNGEQAGVAVYVPNIQVSNPFPRHYAVWRVEPIE